MSSHRNVSSPSDLHLTGVSRCLFATSIPFFDVLAFCSDFLSSSGISSHHGQWKSLCFSVPSSLLRPGHSFHLTNLQSLLHPSSFHKNLSHHITVLVCPLFIRLPSQHGSSRIKSYSFAQFLTLVSGRPLLPIGCSDLLQRHFFHVPRAKRISCIFHLSSLPLFQTFVSLEFLTEFSKGLGAFYSLHHSKTRIPMNMLLLSLRPPVCTSLATLTGCSCCICGIFPLSIRSFPIRICRTIPCDRRCSASTKIFSAPTCSDSQLFLLSRPSTCV